MAGHTVGVTEMGLWLLVPHPPPGAVAAEEPRWGLEACRLETAAGGEEGRARRMESRHVLIPIKAALHRGASDGIYQPAREGLASCPLADGLDSGQLGFRQALSLSLSLSHSLSLTHTHTHIPFSVSFQGPSTEPS